MTTDEELKSENDGNSEYITRHQAYAIAQRAGQSSAHEILTAIGIDVSSSESIIQHQVDSAHLRRHRQGSENLAPHAKKAGIGFTIVAMLGTMWMGLQGIVKVKGG